MALRLFRSSASIPGQWSQLLQNASIAPHAFLRPAISLQIPGILSDIWESVLRAVPKKKTSHMKKRHRQMAGKALKDVKNLNTCSGCGQIKRAHTLCPHCVESMQKLWHGFPGGPVLSTNNHFLDRYQETVGEDSNSLKGEEKTLLLSRTSSISTKRKQQREGSTPQEKRSLARFWLRVVSFTGL